MGLRFAEKKDMKDMTDIYKATIKDEFFKFPTIYINRHIQRNQAVVFEYQNKVIGCYIWTVNKIANPTVSKRSKMPIIWLEQIMVNPDYQGRKIGNILMGSFLKMNGREFRLVCKDNLIEFYKKYGFEVTETIISDNRQKVIMTKRTKSI